MSAENDWIGSQKTSQGMDAGPALKGSMFIPKNMGLVFQDSTGAWWQVRLAQDGAGNTVFNQDGVPTLEIVTVTL